MGALGKEDLRKIQADCEVSHRELCDQVAGGRSYRGGRLAREGAQYGHNVQLYQAEQWVAGLEREMRLVEVNLQEAKSEERIQAEEEEHVRSEILAVETESKEAGIAVAIVDGLLHNATVVMSRRFEEERLEADLIVESDQIWHPLEVKLARLCISETHLLRQELYCVSSLVPFLQDKSLLRVEYEEEEKKGRCRRASRPRES